MNDDVFRKLAGSAQFDQAAEGIATMSKMVAIMYVGYVMNGIPPDLAALLIRDWHYLQTSHSMWPDTPPPMRGEE